MEVFLLILLGLAIIGDMLHWNDRNAANSNLEENRAKLRALQDFSAEHFMLSPNGCGIAIDTARQKLAILTLAGWEVFPYSSIRGAEVGVDGKTVTRTSSSRSLPGAIAGGVLFGGAGAVVGGLGGKTHSTSTEEVGQISLKLHVKDMASPVRIVHFRYYDGFAVAWSCEMTARQQAEDWFMRIQMITEEQEAVPA
jgi:hypothetical protein